MSGGVNDFEQLKRRSRVTITGQLKRITQALLAAARGGDGAAFDRVFRAYQPRLYRFLQRFVGRAEVAAELCQETLLRVYRSLGKYDDGAPARPWIYRIARNLAIDYLRRAERAYVTHGHVDELTAGGIAPDHAAEVTEDLVRMNDALAQLKPADREALLLRTVEGLSYAEIAEVMGRTEEGVKSRYLRARVRIRTLVAAR